MIQLFRKQLLLASLLLFRVFPSILDKDEQLQDKFHNSMWVGFVTGLGVDLIIIAFRKLTPWDFFQSKKYQDD